MEELLKHLGYATPLMYAAAAYGFFHWLDENASDAAKAALARTMTLFKDYKNEQVASALVEVFDRIYTYPLLRWRALFRSLLFTTAVTAVYLFETGGIANSFSARVFPLTVGFVYNFFTDYLSLFVIRRLLIRSGTRPVIGLVLGTVSGIAVVFGGNVLRAVVFLYAYFPTDLTFSYAAYWASVDLFVAMPAFAVFAWLPLFALGILIVRLLTPLSWMVEERSGS